MAAAERIIANRHVVRKLHNRLSTAVLLRKESGRVEHEQTACRFLHAPSFHTDGVGDRLRQRIQEDEMTLHDLGLSGQELWSAIVALCTVGLIFFGRDVLDEFAEDPEIARRVNGKIVAARKPATWASHPLCFSASAFGVSAALNALL